MFNGVKSSYILKEIFEYVPKRIILDLLKYNNHLRKKINITLEDYRIFNQIEIEIIPKEQENWIGNKLDFIKINDDYK